MRNMEPGIRTPRLAAYTDPGPGTSAASWPLFFRVYTRVKII